MVEQTKEKILKKRKLTAIGDKPATGGDDKSTKKGNKVKVFKKSRTLSVNKSDKEDNNNSNNNNNNNNKRVKLHSQPNKKAVEGGVPSQLSKRDAKAAELQNICKEANILTAKILLKAKNDKTERNKLVDKLFHLLQPKLLDLSMKHDTCRAIQCCFKHSNDKQKDIIINTLLLDESITANKTTSSNDSKVMELCKGTYSCFTVVALMKHANPGQLIKILKLFDRKMLKLAVHTIAAHVVDSAVRLENTDIKEVKAMRKKLFNEFYGQRMQLLNPDVQRYLKSRDLIIKGENTPVLSDVDKTSVSTIVIDMKKLLLKMIDKGLLRFLYVQKFLYEWLLINLMLQDPSNASAEGEITSIIDYFMDPFLLLFASNEGAKSLIIMISLANAKQKKQMIKKLTGDHEVFKNALYHPFGHKVLLALINCTDDTVVLKKQVMQNIGTLDSQALLNGILSQEPSNCIFVVVMFYLLAPDEKSCLRIINQADLILMRPRNNTSKKDLNIKYKELRSSSSEFNAKLLQLCEKRETLEKLIMDRRGHQFVAALVHCFYTLSKPIQVELAEILSKNLALFENLFTHLLLKQVIIDEGKIDALESESFSSTIWNLMKTDLPSHIRVNRSGFILVTLLESKHLKKDVAAFLKKSLKTYAETKPSETPALKIIKKLLSK